MFILYMQCSISSVQFWKTSRASGEKPLIFLIFGSLIFFNSVAARAIGHSKGLANVTGIVIFDLLGAGFGFMGSMISSISSSSSGPWMLDKLGTGIVCLEGAQGVEVSKCTFLTSGWKLSACPSVWYSAAPLLVFTVPGTMLKT